jgi:DNA-binding transcriptional LysR family regulator
MRGSRFAELSAFVAVADHGSFTKAAAQLRMSTGSLSQAIRALEEGLGVRLLNRTTRSVAPTEAGEQVLMRLRPLLDDFAAVVDSVNAFRDRPAGQLRLTVPPPVASFVLAPLLARFHAQYPEIVIEISAAPELTDIVAGRFDAGIRSGNRVARDMIAVRITEDRPFVVVASPDYLARHPRPQTPHDLQAQNCIRTRFAGGVFHPWMFAVDGKIVEFEVEGTVIANQPEILIRATLDGIGLFYAAEDYIASMIPTGRLVPLLEAWMPPPSDGFYLYYPSRRQNTAALQALIDFLRANLKAGGGSARAADRLRAAKGTTGDR